MTDCPFTLNADDLWQCPTCGWVYPHKSDKPPRRNCPATRKPLTQEQSNAQRAAEGVFYGVPLTPEEIASRKVEAKRQEAEAIELGKSLGWTFEDAIHWAAALVRWQKAGRPQRSNDEVKSIVKICEACEEYKADEMRCQICRCGVSRKSKLPIFNKAALETEHCPQQKW